jgi:hypothetical protein
MRAGRHVAWNTISRGEDIPEKRANHSKFELGRSPNAALSELNAEQPASQPMISSSAEPYTWIWVDAPYLREQAQRCVRLARDCPHLPTAHELEAIGVELMQKAAELDHLQDNRDASRAAPE